MQSEELITVINIAEIDTYVTPATIRDMASEDIVECARAWGIDRDAALIALSLALLYHYQGVLRPGDIIALAHTVDLYGQERERVGYEDAFAEKGE